MARALVRQLMMLIATLVVAAPLVFGPAFAWALDELGGGPVHTCACGMKQGTCGCPECARLTAEKKAEDAPTAYRTFKRACNDDAPATPAAPLPPAVAALASIAPPPTPVARAVLAPVLVLRTRDRAPPPPPPPRALAV
jgi:hypothetical protein